MVRTWPIKDEAVAGPPRDRFPDSCFRAIVQSLSNRFQNWLDMRPTPRYMGKAGPSSVDQGRCNSFHYAALPLAPEMLILPNKPWQAKQNSLFGSGFHLTIPPVAKMRHLPIKKHHVVKHWYPLNDSGGAQNAIPANENAPNR